MIDPQNPTLKERLLGKPRVLAPGYIIEGKQSLQMDGEVVRTRSTLLHCVAWSACIHIFFIDDKAQQDAWFLMLYILMSTEFLTSAISGCAPLAPIGTLATVMCHFLGPVPSWCPATPKRFAWSLGFGMAQLCYWSYYFEVYALTQFTIVACMGLTFLETSCAFCVGCWMWNTFIGPRLFKTETCEVCSPRSMSKPAKVLP